MFHGINLIPTNTRIRFIQARTITFVFSGVITLLSIVGVFWPGINFGIDFRGGVLIEARSTQGPADLAAMRAQLDGLHLGEIALQDFGSDRDVLIRVAGQADDRANNAAVARVRETLGANFEIRRTEIVGPKVGRELVQSGLIATVLALLGIALYVWFRFEWQFGVAALIATFHDCITTVGVLAFLQIDFNLASVAAVLTIAGYSINDTVVIFDRIRENMRKYKTMEFGELMDRSINETLSRSILTHLTTFLAVIALVVIGGEVIRSFTIAMVWGVVFGAYSSIFLAAPLLLYMKPVRRSADPVPAPTVAP
jgi:preprotein translocase subunit SecF